MQSSPSENTWLCRPADGVWPADWLWVTLQSLLSALLCKKRELCKCFSWCSLVYPPVLREAGSIFGNKECQSVCRKEPYAILPAQGYCQGYHCLSLPSLLLPLKCALFIYFTNKAGELHRSSSHFYSPLWPYLPTERFARIFSTANCEGKRSWHRGTHQRLV